MLGAERVIDFAEAAAHLSLRYEQLVIRRNGEPEVTVPMAEIAAVIMSSPRLTVTHPALAGVYQSDASGQTTA